MWDRLHPPVTKDRGGAKSLSNEGKIKGGTIRGGRDDDPGNDLDLRGGGGNMEVHVTVELSENEVTFFIVSINTPDSHVTCIIDQNTCRSN